VSVSGDSALIGVPVDSDNGYQAGCAYLFTRHSTVWEFTAKLIADDGVEYDIFGSSVSLDGDIALVGAPRVAFITDPDSGGTIFNDVQGRAYVYSRSGSVWSQQAKLMAYQVVLFVHDSFGISVSVNHDTALIGASGGGGELSGEAISGVAYVFVRSESTWSLQEQLRANDGVNGDAFGDSVSLCEDTALVGSRRNDENGNESGSAYVFLRSGVAWSQQAKLLANDGAAFDEFGHSVSLSGDTALISALALMNAFINDGRTDAGRAYVFTRSAGDWSLQQKIYANDTAAEFGISVCVSGDTALVGAPGSQLNLLSLTEGLPGSAYLFTRSNDIWTQQQKIQIEDGSASDYFGYSVSLDGDTALIGAYLDDGIDLSGGLVADQGSVYIFRLSTIGTDTDSDGASDTWEAANDFNSAVPDDYLTLDTDLDGALDLLEIFQGTDKNSATSGYGLLTQSADGSTQSMKARFRRSTASTGVAATYHWSPNLTDWYIGGMDAEGIKVEFAESVVETGADYEIVELTATITLGSADELFIRMAVKPVE